MKLAARVEECQRERASKEQPDTAGEPLNIRKQRN